MTTYMECFAYDTNLKKQLARKTEVSHGAPSTSNGIPANASAH